MDPVTAVGSPHAEDREWLPVTDAGSVGTVRRAAAALGYDLGLSEGRRGDLAIVASELASNLFKHATDGVVHLRAVRTAVEAGVQVLAIDAGPGMADLPVSSRDGHSTAGTLGIGLGGVARQSSELDAFSQPGRGTVLAASVWEHAPPAPAWAAALTRPMAGEKVCGDGYALRERDGRRQVLLCDGLGHGPLAAAATQALVAAFAQAPAGRPAEVLDHLHRAAAHTRGAVAAVAELDPEAGVVRCASVGNISCTVVTATTRRALASQPGIVGDRQRRTIREYPADLPVDGALVLHTDGVTSGWDLTRYPGLLTHAPLVIAATVLRDGGTRRDDAGVLVARPGPR